jgi:hypothetical protein
MSEQDETLMAKFDITCEPKMIYSYKAHRYENFKDALNYAQIDTTRVQEDCLQTRTEK